MNKKALFNILISTILAVGILLRIYAFIPYRALWRDECSLALNIYFGNFLDLWKVLIHVQSAPPLFMTICKIFNSVNPFLPEYFIRLCPFIAGIISIFLFYKLTKNFFESKLAIIASNLIFATNFQLIYFSHEFKQYSTDVMAIIALLLYFSHLDISALSKKKIVLHSVIIALFPFLSLPSLFVIAGWLCINLINKQNIGKLFILILPAAVLNFIYYIVTLIPSRKIMLEAYNFLWKDGFLQPNLTSIISIIKDNISFYFCRCKYILIPICLIVCGIVIMLRRRKQIDKTILYTIAFVLIASFMKIYPIKDRVSLYLLPLAILIAALPFDLIKSKIIKISSAILIVSLIGDMQLKDLITSNNEHTPYMMETLKSNYKRGDYVIYNDVSDSQFVIYSYTRGFKVLDNKTGKIQLVDYDEDWYYRVLNNIPKNNKYWFFYPYDIEAKPVIPFLKNWAHKNGKILYEKDFGNRSYLLYLQL